MNNENVKDWLQLADDDLYSAKLLSEAVRKPYEIICYHCAQAAEKYLKGYLTYRDIVPKKTHDLVYLNRMCIDIDNEFSNVKTMCDFLNRFASDIRYPHKFEVYNDDVNFSINSIEKIKNLKPIIDMRKELDEESNN
jgi:HEPN domain-containing protein